MCRIAIGNGKLFSVKELTDIFTVLDKSNGGDGVGIWFANGTVIKDVKPDFGKIAEEVVEKQMPFVFHTRKRSVGPTGENGLHPVGAGDGYFLVQNGTLQNWHTISEQGWSFNKTDTMAVGELVAKYGAGVLASRALRDAGVYVLMGNDGIVVFKRRGRSFVLHDFGGGKWLYASEYIAHLTTNEAESRVYVVEDETVFRVGEDGMPKKYSYEVVEPETNHGAATAQFDYDYAHGRNNWDWWDDAPKTRSGNFSIAGEEMARLAMLMPDNRELEVMARDWLNGKQDMCPGCKLPYCPSACPMVIGIEAWEEKEDENSI